MMKNKDKFPIIDKKETAKRLKYFMKCNNLKPSDIQNYLGLTCIQTIYRWLEGINVPNIDNLYALSQLFNVRIDDMLAGNRKSLVTCNISRQSLRMVTYYVKIKNIA